MDPNDEVEQDFPPFLCIYKSGRVHRYFGTSVVPPSEDPAAAVLSKDVIINSETGLSARLYIPNFGDNVPPSSKLPILVYYHGGGFCNESASSPTYHTFLNSFAEKTRVVVVSVNYRLAPEHKLPIAYDDSWEALQWVVSGHDSWLDEHGDSKMIFVAGDSAGANIAHQMALRGVGMNIKGAMLIHPYFGKEIVDPDENAWSEFWKMLSSIEVDDPRHNPMVKGGKGTMEVACDRVMVCIAENDFLVERGLEYYEKLKGSEWQGEVEFMCSEGEGHVFHLQKPGCDKGVELIDRLITFINKK